MDWLRKDFSFFGLCGYFLRLVFEEDLKSRPRSQISTQISDLNLDLRSQGGTNQKSAIKNLLGDNRAHLHHFKIRSLDALQLIQLIVTPARVRRATDEPVRAVVSQNHAVLLQGAQDHL